MMPVSSDDRFDRWDPSSQSRVDLPVVVLASGSPRRLDLLRSAGLEPLVAPMDIDESVRAGESPTEYVERLAAEKAAAVPAELLVRAAELAGRERAEVAVVAADTTVDLDGRILAKPEHDSEAVEMLTALSGRAHAVHTGVAVARGDAVETFVVSTAVVFAALGRSAIEWYVASGDPFDKAGGYGMQSGGAFLVERIDGSATNVIGLPLAETLARL